MSSDSLFMVKTKQPGFDILSVEVKEMNLIMIGKFIAELRKEAGFTQEQFGQALGVTNKTVSRWETGVYLPPADALLAMSELFHITINELLAGKRLPADEYKKAAEENLLQTVKASSFTLKEKIEYYQKKWLTDHISSMVLIGVTLAVIFAAGIIRKNSLAIYAFWILFILAHCWRNNSMMAYVESKAYDGNGPDPL